jgi:DNA topoisomerase-2
MKRSLTTMSAEGKGAAVAEAKKIKGGAKQQKPKTKQAVAADSNKKKKQAAPKQTTKKKKGPEEDDDGDDGMSKSSAASKASGASKKQRDGVSTDASAGFVGEAQFKQLTLREQILLRPGMWVGSTSADACVVWLYDAHERRMEQRTITYVPAFLKLFDEILMNAVDHATNQKTKKNAGNEDVNLVRNIRVTIDKETGSVEVTNDGDGIPVFKNENDIYIPELIFGHLLTSSNYDDEEQKEGRIVGGQNGIGAKACNIYSTRFEVETVDHARKLAYAQKFEDHMSVAHPPSVTRCSKKPYTTVRFCPDYERFGMATGMTNEAYDLLVKRVYDASAITDPDVAVHLNGAKLECHTFEKYVDLYAPPSETFKAGEKIYEKVNDWWEVAATCSDGNGPQQVSFVNGVCTFRGGKHVEHVVNQIVRKLTDMIQSKRSTAAASASGIKAQFIKDNLFVFVKATIPNPSFDGQCKDTLSTPVAKFGGAKVELSDKFIEKLYKSGIVERVLTLNDATADKSLKRTDGKKQTSISGIPKLDDANWAGGPKSAQCTLILTEGDSAKTMAIAGLTQAGRDRYGVFPLRGKVMNVCDTKAATIAANAEISNLKKIMGLESGRDYADVTPLRYGKIMIMTDQDVDGSHIKGLLFNLFHQLWPSLLKVEGFITSMLTPIVKARRRGQPILEFYNGADYEAWKAANDNGKGWDVKYYKGLGTSTSAEAKEYFRALKVATYAWSGGPSSEAIDMAFNKDRANSRKEWLLNYDKTCGLDFGEKIVSFEDFINKDLVHFSSYDVARSIPSVCDGLKISQRKILFACLKRNLVKKPLKVAQLAGYVSENSAYHHGENSLNDTIVGMAQDFVGANNVNLLLPDGQFGSRIQGGKDSAAPRYIHTLLSPLASALIKAEDSPVLNFLEDDGLSVEPEYYLPILPMVLVNGAFGVGTGFMTTIPCFNPLDVCRSVRALLDATDRKEEEGVVIHDTTQEDLLAAAAADLPELTPWYRGFQGTIERLDDNGRYSSRGCYRRTKPNEVLVYELPVGYWTDKFKEVADAFKQAVAEVKDVRHNHSESTVSHTIVFTNPSALDAYMAVEDEGGPGSGKVRQTKLEKALKLVSNSNLSTTNMHLFNREGRIKKYDTINDIIVEYYGVRLAAYATRKRILLGELRYQASVLENKIRFLQAVIDETIVIHRRDKADLEKELEAAAYMRVDDAYEYLLRMPLSSLTVDKMRQLQANLKDTQDRIHNVETTTEKDMWRQELDAFERKYVEVRDGKTLRRNKDGDDDMEQQEEDDENEEA